MAQNATIGSRIVAVIIDHVILWVIAMIIAMPLGFSVLFFNSIFDLTMLVTMLLFNFILWILYFSYFEGKSGQTPGKRVMGIKVIKEKGTMTYGDAFLRTILRIIDGIAFYILGLIIVVVSEKDQRLGDMAAGTIVVKA